jgi:hypothetical protein
MVMIMNKFDPNSYEDDFFDTPLPKVEEPVEEVAEKPKKRSRKKKDISDVPPVLNADGSESIPAEPKKKSAPRKKKVKEALKLPWYKTLYNNVTNMVGAIFDPVLTVINNAVDHPIGRNIIGFGNGAVIMIVHWIIAPMHLFFFILHHLFFRWVTLALWSIIKIPFPFLVAVKYGVFNKVFLIFTFFLLLYGISMFAFVILFFFSLYNHYDNIYFYLELFYMMCGFVIFVLLPFGLWNFMQWLNSKVETTFFDYNELVRDEISINGGAFPYMFVWAFWLFNAEAINIVTTGKVEQMGYIPIFHDVFNFGTSSDVAIMGFCMCLAVSVQGLFQVCEDIGIWTRIDRIGIV